MQIRLKAEEVIKINQKIIDNAPTIRDSIIKYELDLFHEKMILAANNFKKKWNTRIFHKRFLNQEISREDCLKFLRKEEFDYTTLFARIIVDEGTYSETWSSFSMPKIQRKIFMDRLRRLVSQVNTAKQQIENCQVAINIGDGYVIVNENGY